MSDLQPKGVKVNFDGVEREFLFTFSAIDELESRFDKPITEILKEATNFAKRDVIRAIVTALVNADVTRHNYSHSDEWETVDDDYVGSFLYEDIKGGNVPGIFRAIMEAYGLSAPKPDEDEDPNRKSGRRKKLTSPASSASD